APPRTRTFYDIAGRVAEVQGPTVTDQAASGPNALASRSVVRYVYDDLGRQVQTREGIVYEGINEDSPLWLRSSESAYDGQGNLVSQTTGLAPAGGLFAAHPTRVSYAYDSANRRVTLTEVGLPEGRQTEWAYDKAGNLIQETRRRVENGQPA